uniref:Lipoprotein transport system permease protein n=2 Tax=Candidatus Bipolaricaulota TaxID=67810 RepID=H5SH14_9BACT|nr:lipoprotein transport system permease protein [uncultured Acetothermia bacterium]BAL55450.1 lipoprotein transport system permease protein [uncultured Acetothermia bacterium]BAL60186.1 lipoprotein transport system permease protein [Candidatus Acetothermum autotrophicum]
MFFKIAARNVLRNKRRTAFSLGVTALGVAILYFVMGFITESFESVKRNLTREIGAVQIADAKLFDNRAERYEYLISPETLQKIEALLKDDPRVTGYTWTLGFAGLIGNEKGSTLVVGRGLIPGNPIEDYSRVVVAGRPLTNDGTPQILIGRRLAETLNVRPGDVINVASGTASGAFNAASATIVGTIRYNNITQEGQIGIANLEFVQQLLRTRGVERVIIQLADLDQAEAFAQELKAKLAAQEIALDARPWQKLTAFYDSIRAFWNVFAAFTTMGVFVLVFFSVLEVLTMSFLERTREVGTIRAVGTTRSQVFRIFLAEGTILGLLGGLLGVTLGAVLAVGLNNATIRWLPPGALDPVPVRIAVNLSVAVVPFLTALISTFLGTLYPAWKTARKNIVEALSYV